MNISLSHIAASITWLAVCILNFVLHNWVATLASGWCAILHYYIEYTHKNHSA